AGPPAMRPGASPNYHLPAAIPAFPAAGFLAASPPNPAPPAMTTLHAPSPATRRPALVDRVLAGGRVGQGYALRLASGEADVRAAQALRFAVFNVELNEGLAASFSTGLDADRFD